MKKTFKVIGWIWKAFITIEVLAYAAVGVIDQLFCQLLIDDNRGSIWDLAKGFVEYVKMKCKWIKSYFVNSAQN